MLHALTFAMLATTCAPQVAPTTIAAIVRVESGGDALAIGDNTAHRAYHPRDRESAEALARALIAAGHSVDLGIAQIDDENLAPLGLTIHSVFDPCTNLAAAATILSQDYKRAVQRYGAGQEALRRAIGMYNTGRLDAGAGYARRVLLAAGVADRERSSSAVAAVSFPVVNERTVAARVNLKRSVSPWRAPILVTGSASVAVF